MSLTKYLIYCGASAPNKLFKQQLNWNLVTGYSRFVCQTGIKQGQGVTSTGHSITSHVRKAGKYLLTKPNRLLSYLRPKKLSVGGHGRGLLALRTVGRLGAVPSVSLALFPFGWRSYKEQHKHDLSPEILSHIPKEVFKKDILRKKLSGNIVRRFFRSVLEAIKLSLRCMRILLTFGPIISMYPLTYLSHSFTLRWWNMLLVACEWSGPTFIKLGQWASTRRDLFSAEFCNIFIRLHSDTQEHSWMVTKQKLQKAFGKRWREIFIKMDKQPIGSGCIAQVHKAYMAADMIPDESLVEDFVDDSDDDDAAEPDIDFLEGLEVMGYGHSDDSEDDAEEAIPLRPKAKPSDPNAQPPPQRKLYHSSFFGNSSDHSDTIIPETKTDTQDSPESVDTEDQPDSEDPNEEGSSWIQTTPDPNENINTPGHEDEMEEIPLLPVAVKVLHPGVYKLVSRDMKILRFCVKFIQFLFPSLRWLSLSESLEEFNDLLIRQIDLRFEAECLEILVTNFEDEPQIRFPTPIRPYCKRDVLVETFEDGEPVSNYLRDDESYPEGLKAKLAELGADALLKMVFTDDFVHGDLHPGNILVQNAEHYTTQDENKMMIIDVGDTLIVSVKPVECPLRLIMLDAGIAVSLREKDLENFRAVFRAVVLGEGERVAELMLKHARSNDCKDVAAFKEELGELVMKARADTIQLGNLQMGDLLSSIFAVLIKHKVKMESNFSSVLLAIFVLEGLGRSLDPDLDILERAKPVLLNNI